VATGTDAETLRVTEVGPKMFARVALVVGVVLGIALVGFILYVFLAG
jgi:hypothetical protein